MMRGTSRGALAHRLNEEDRGSLPLALMMALVGIAMTALLVPVVFGQLSGTSQSVRRANALNAAQAGLDIALGHIRAARVSDTDGDFDQLPCTDPNAPITGTVGGGSARYQVKIQYRDIFKVPVECGSRATTFAMLESIGTDIPTGDITTVTRRTLTARYELRLTNENVSGGLVHVYKTTNLDLCFDAGSTSPAPGTNLQMQPCTPGKTTQLFSYNTDLTLTLVSSKTPFNPAGMCVDGGSPATVGKLAQFRPCVTAAEAALTPSKLWPQQWSINDNANFEGTSNGSSLNGFCLNVQSPNTPGSFVVVTKTCGGPYNNVKTFSPDAAVGAGAAGGAVNQVVNFEQFGRCIDVTEGNVNYAYLIVWPCKQAPNPNNVLWNQKWDLPDTFGTPDRIFTTRSGVKYCLKSTSTAAEKYVTVQPCPAGATPANMLWTVTGDTGTYATSYVATDFKGRCLQPTDPDAPSPDLYLQGNKISKIIVAPCDGSKLQKWNAPPNILDAQRLKDIREL